MDSGAPAWQRVPGSGARVLVAEPLGNALPACLQSSAALKPAASPRASSARGDWMFTRSPGSRGPLRRQPARGANEPQRSATEARLWQPGASLPGRLQAPSAAQGSRGRRGVARETRSRVSGVLLTGSRSAPPGPSKSLGHWTLDPGPVISPVARGQGEKVIISRPGVCSTYTPN